jgi:hypothetical protein
MILVGIPVHESSIAYLPKILSVWSNIGANIDLHVVVNNRVSDAAWSQVALLSETYMSRVHVTRLSNGYYSQYGCLRAALTCLRHRALSGPYTHLLINEATRIGTIQSAKVLISQNQPVAGCLYKDTHHPGYYCVYQWDGMSHGMELYRDIDRINGPIEVAGIGFGMIAIRRDVLDVVPFRSALHAPDTYFSEDAKEQDIAIHALPVFVDNTKIDYDAEALSFWVAARTQIVMFRDGDSLPDRIGLSASSQSDRSGIVEAAATGDGAKLSGLLDRNPALLYTCTSEDSSYGTGSTLLHIAAGHGHSDIVQLLLSRGLPANSKTHTGATALHFAAQAGHLRILQMLLCAGADVHCKDGVFGASAIEWAQFFRHYSACILLKKASSAGALVERDATR